ncbi:potassium-transporting ATPase subunit F [Nocardia sp. NPDC005366]|uniref:potassium-transporting ATPase subunit F n=1 Tax=Nocardia sp. NPDC005366 TaxID=3156878 RepID=UPI0033B4521C
MLVDDPLRTRKEPRRRLARALDSSVRVPRGDGARRLVIHVCRGLHDAHRGGVRAARPDSAGGFETVIANAVGLVLAVLVALYMVAALLFPERF